MTNKELKKLTRTELLELLLAQTERADSLEKEIKELRKKLSEKEIAIQNSGSIAEAALKINDIFNAAQAAADQYLMNIKGDADMPFEQKTDGRKNESPVVDLRNTENKPKEQNAPQIRALKKAVPLPCQKTNDGRILVHRKPVREEDIDDFN
ncbi:MAG: hypothetical protein K6F76_00345 [Clostridiales bacterium]|nr:hypothetical protein [Clostridiales bacterium]